MAMKLMRRGMFRTVPGNIKSRSAVREQRSEKPTPFHAPGHWGTLPLQASIDVIQIIVTERPRYERREILDSTGATVAIVVIDNCGGDADGARNTALIEYQPGERVKAAQEKEEYYDEYEG